MVKDKLVIIAPKSQYYKKLKLKGLKHLDEQDLEVVLFQGLEREASNFLLKSDVKTSQYFVENKTKRFIGKMSWGNRNANDVIITGAHPNISFRISRYLMDNYDEFLNQGKGLGYITIRKHEGNLYHVEKFEPLKLLKEESFKLICDLRKKYGIEEWKNILLGSVGYDLRDSTGLTRDLLLVRLLPYIEKNYNYIELGGKSTGKTTIAEKFNTGEKINASMSAANFIYSTQKKKYGMLFSKDVLYLDEMNFTSMDKEVAPALLQAKAGNKIEVRGNHDSRRAEVSFVSQGNIEAAEYQFKTRNLLKSFDKGFNNDAHFDRECFLIAGWLIPSYSKMSLKEDTLGIRLDIFEDYLSVLREKGDYSDLIPDVYINLVGSSATGRFNDQIKKTMSGFLKVFYPEEILDLAKDKEIVDGIVLLSCLGKYLIQEGASDLGKKEYKNDYLEFSYGNTKRHKITRNSLENIYVKAKEMKYFQEETIKEKEEIEEEIIIPWNTEDNEIIELKGNLKFLKERMYISEEIQAIFDEIPKENGREKEKLEDLYKAVEGYKESNKANSDIVEYVNAHNNLVIFLKYMVKLKKIYDEGTIIKLRSLVDFLKYNLPKKEEYKYSSKTNFILAELQENPDKKELEEIDHFIEEIEVRYKSKKMLYMRGLTGRLASGELSQEMYKLETLKDNSVRLLFVHPSFKGRIELTLKNTENIMNYKLKGYLSTIDKNNEEKSYILSESTSDVIQNNSVYERSHEEIRVLEENKYLNEIKLYPFEKFNGYFKTVSLNIILCDIKTDKELGNMKISIFDNREELEKSMSLRGI